MLRAVYGSPSHVATADKKEEADTESLSSPIIVHGPYNSPPYNSQAITDYTAAATDYSM